MGMLNQIATAVVRKSIVVREYQTLMVTGAKRRGTVYSPSHGRIVGFNFGTSVRPEVAPIKVNTIGDETVESYLARGGRILQCKSSRRNHKALTFNPYDVRKTPSAGSWMQRKQKFEPAFLLR